MTLTIDPAALAPAPPETLAAPGGMLVILDARTGDTRIEWHPDDRDEVEAARRTFDDLVLQKGRFAYAVQPDGQTGRQLREFDPAATRIVIVPRLAGG